MNSIIRPLPTVIQQLHRTLRVFQVSAAVSAGAVLTASLVVAAASVYRASEANRAAQTRKYL